MATFYEVKHLLCKLLGQERLNDDEIVNNDDDIVFEPRSFRVRQETRQITILNSDLVELYNKVFSMNTNDLELYSEDGYEVAINMNYYLMRHQEFPFKAEDEINGISVNGKSVFPTKS